MIKPMYIIKLTRTPLVGNSDVFEINVSALCFFSRDLIKVFKWYVDRVIEAEHQDHIQQVLKVRPPRGAQERGLGPRRCCFGSPRHFGGVGESQRLRFSCLSLQASEYIFKYIIQSRRLFSLATGGQNEEEFRVCIHELFMSIRFFLSQENKGATPVSQTQVGTACSGTRFGSKRSSSLIPLAWRLCGAAERDLPAAPSLTSPLSSTLICILISTIAAG